MFKENIHQMRERHLKEIEELEDNCSHENISDWLDYMWAIGHYMGQVKVCRDCGKIVEKDSIIEEE